MTPQRPLEHRAEDLYHTLHYGTTLDLVADELLSLGPFTDSPQGINSVDEFQGGALAFEAYKRWAQQYDMYHELSKKLQQCGYEFGKTVLDFVYATAKESNMHVYGEMRLCVPGAIPSDHPRYRELCSRYAISPGAKLLMHAQGNVVSSYSAGSSETIVSIDYGYRGSLHRLADFFNDLPQPQHMHSAKLAIENESGRGYFVEANMVSMFLRPLTLPVQPKVYEMFKTIPSEPRKAA